MNQPLSGKVAVAGVGSSTVDRNRSSNLPELVLSAVREALDDAGLDRTDIDGMVLSPTVPDDIGFDRLPIALGLQNVRWTMQTWRHDQLLPITVMGAVMAIAAGFASTVIFVGMAEPLVSFDRRIHADPSRFEDWKPDYYGPGLEVPCFGGTTPHVGAALALRLYLSRYGYTASDLAAVALAQRQWANLNPGAYFYREQLSLTQYLEGGFVVEPLRVHDCGLPANGAYSFILTSSGRAKDLRKELVAIKSWQGGQYGPDGFIFGRPGLGVGAQRPFKWSAPRWEVYDMAGLDASDIDALFTLDTFSSLVPFCLELFGYCEEGEGLSFLSDGRSAPGGSFPINTSGGGLSESDSRGYGHLVEIVRQLRGECGERQLPNVAVAQYANPDGSSLILTRE
jgi:acetyl-CoA acetyltransferase